MEIDRNFFDKFVFGFMCEDIKREIGLARSGKTAGNFLCALGLLCYTEFMGGLISRNFSLGSAGKRFNEFFDYLGDEYKSFRRNTKVYNIFRCGLAHEYFVKHECVIVMLNGPDPVTIPGISSGGPSYYVPDATIPTPIKIGIGRATNNRYFFIVEQYYIDFRAACGRLLEEFESGQRGPFPFHLPTNWPDPF